MRVTFYARDPLTVTLPPFLPAGPAGLPARAGPLPRALPVGLAEDGKVYRLRLLGLHVLVVGASGAGKASVFWSIVTALAPLVRTGSVVLHGVDPKRMELVFAPELFARLTTGTPADAADHLEALVRDMQDRQDRMTGIVREHTATPDDPALVLVIDELASLTAYCTDRDAKKRIEAALSLLLSQGRAVGVYVLAAIQDPRKDVVTFRDLFTTRIALRVTEAGHVDMVLGDGALDRGAAAHRIPDTLPGVGYVLIEGAAEPVRVRFTYLTDTHIRGLAAAYAPGAPDPHHPSPTHPTSRLSQPSSRCPSVSSTSPVPPLRSAAVRRDRPGPGGRPPHRCRRLIWRARLKRGTRRPVVPGRRRRPVVCGLSHARLRLDHHDRDQRDRVHRRDPPRPHPPRRHLDDRLDHRLDHRLDDRTDREDAVSGYYDRGGRLRQVRIYPHPDRRENVVTIDEHGGVRSGPSGAWWTELTERPTHRLGDVRASVELPSGRAVAWNLAFLAVEAGLAVWAHSQGVSWGSLALGVGLVIGAGVALVAWFVTVYTPRARRRERARIRAAHEQTLRRTDRAPIPAPAPAIERHPLALHHAQPGYVQGEGEA